MPPRCSTRCTGRPGCSATTNCSRSGRGQQAGRPSDPPAALGGRRHRLARPRPAGRGGHRAGRRPAGPRRLPRMGPVRGQRTGRGLDVGGLRACRLRALGNLTAILDVNRLGQRGETRHGWDTGAYARRIGAFGWQAIEIDGHDIDAIDAALPAARTPAGSPRRSSPGRSRAAGSPRYRTLRAPTASRCPIPTRPSPNSAGFAISRPGQARARSPARGTAGRPRPRR